ncbi:benzoate/H(+) symporter BenE family transporter [Aromatoleum toluvorans]|uniref:Benzoate/H(+) symporter BenE family transporter n=1 Tax=Aromatoleum toluvorans TaxID=92002 RepID=A0ABX1Q3M9_9RHOO|nr:benzoate/H(+) symporter BenE family transporter [Aromatoleum toluvorans]NMG45356.1 benzoate/H(+) symporter BenE family transporter [Aromatoleum toluvorans]
MGNPHAASGIARHFPHVAAGFIAVLVGYTSSAAIVFQAAHAAGATPSQLASWLWALGLGMAVTCIALSLRYRTPILTAWSTPGAALLATGLVGVPMSEAIGAFLFASVLMALLGFSGGFERIMRHVPPSLSAAMLAGILLRFGLGAFSALGNNLALVGTMIVVFFVARRLWPRYAVPLAFLAGLVVAAASGSIATGEIRWQLSAPELMMPSFSPATLIGVGLPLFVVTLATQNVPGLAVLRANGYATPASPLLGWTGITGVVLAPFGGFSFNLAAITAAICMSRDADPDPARRYLASVWAGGFYLLTGIGGATVASLLTAFPQALVVAIAGLALIGTIAGSLTTALAHEEERDAAVVTFLVTASGLTLFGVGSAFWGLVFGYVVSHALRRPQRGAA